jgi:hypothetical protein
MPRMRSVAFDIPVRGQLHHADGENHPAEQNIAQPVGGNAQGKMRVMVPPGSPSRE